jgi:phage terminase large subunit
LSIHIDFSPVDEFINLVYRPFLDDYRRYQILKGGAGAGKSVFISDRIIYNVVLLKGYNVLVIRNVSRDNHDSTFAELQKSISKFGLDDLFEINKSKGAEEIVFKLNKNKIIFRGLDNVEKVKSITFSTGDLVCIWIEEASEINEKEFNQLDLRLRGVGDIPKHVILSFNPIDIDSWLKSRFFDSPLSPNDGYILETTYKDNLYIDDQYKKILEGYESIDYYYYMVYVLNQWGAQTTARIFHNLVIEDFDFKEYDFSNRRMGQDYGFNHANAMLGVGYRDGELFVWYETYCKRKLNSEFIQLVNESGIAKDYIIKGDSAEPGNIREWNLAGYQVYPCEKFPGSLKQGITYLKNLKKIHIHKTNCPNAAREFPRFKYKELKDGTILDEPVEIDDDTIAAVRYAVDEFIQYGVNENQSHFLKKRKR